jgi:TRAP-type transport system periplasmic protein
MLRHKFARIFPVLVALVLVMAFLVGACSSSPAITSTSADTEPGSTKPPLTSAVDLPAIKLTASSYLPQGHMLSSMMGDMMKEIESQSGGRLQINYAAGGSILTGANTADGIEHGKADIGLSHIGYTPGRFPVTEALDLPVGYSSSWVASNVALDYLAKYNPTEWSQFKLLLVNGTTTASINMAKDPVRKLEDLAGKNMRGIGEVADVLKVLGAVPFDMPMEDVYKAMSTGTIDGLLIASESLTSFKLADVTKYTTYVPSIGNSYLFYIAMNRGKWDSLGADLQKIFTNVAAKYQPLTAVGWNVINAQGFQTAVSQGSEYITLSADEAARWKTAVLPVLDNYVTRMTARGLSEQETRDHLAYLKDRLAYWTQQAAALNIPSEAFIPGK